MAITQKQIALHLGLSQPLVAQALKGHPDVAEKTRQRIVEAAQELGYGVHSNVAARSLVARRHGQIVKTGQIAVLMGDFHEGLPLQNLPFFREILQGIHEEAGRDGLDVAIHIARPGTLPRVVTSGGVDGVICVYSRTISHDLEAANIPLPVVRLAGYQATDWSIYPDDECGIYQATRHLLDLGHRNIAYIGGWESTPLDPSQPFRLAGYLKALREAAITVSPDLMYAKVSGPTEQAGKEAMSVLLDGNANFSAAVCANDIAALGAISVAQERGLRVPDDLSITGFDGNVGIGYGTDPTLTTVFFDRHAMGRRAVAMLEEIAGQSNALPRHDVLPTSLLVRGTTAIPSLMVPTL